MSLLKFIDAVGANNIIKGNLRFGFVRDYRNDENNIVNGKQDAEEACFFTKKYATPYGNSINVRFQSDQEIGHALCLYHHIDDEPDIKGLKRMANFGDHVVYIKDEQEFIHRIDIAIQGKEYKFLRRDVFYYSESIEDEIKAMQILSLGKEYFPFLKREADFSYQKEYRYLIIDENANNNVKYIEVEAGNLIDIAEIQLANEFINKYK